MNRLSLVASIIVAIPALASAQPNDALTDSPGAIDVSEPDPTVTAPAPTPTSDSAELGYKNGFFMNSADGKFGLKIQGRVQGRAEWSNEDPGMDADRENSSAFSIPRARLTLGGHAFTKDIKYKFQTDFGKGFVTLKDFFVDYKVGTPIVRIGQYKRPFSRQQIASSGRLELVDRAITDRAFFGGRDLGIMVHNNYEKSPELEWAVGIFNGSGDKPGFSGEADPMTGEIDGGFSNVPSDIRPALVARFGINRNGIKGYHEADLEGGPLRFAVGGSVLAIFDGDNDDASNVAGQIDAIVKQNGITGSVGVYVASAQDGTGFADQSYAAFGTHVQAGYMLGKTMQPAVRYAVVAPDEGDASHELAAAFSIYKFKHGLKWQTDVALLGTGGLSDEFRARSQVQLSF